jgi:hypothetical protein
MSFNDQNQYSPNHKVWDHVGNMMPNVFHSEGGRPAHEFRPASWLPVCFFDKYYEQWETVMPGKLVALDPDGNVMTAQYGLTGQSVVYTQNDVDAGVVDVATGAPVTVPKTVSLAELTGVRDGTWTPANAGTAGVTSGYLGRFGSSFDDASPKYPVGVAAYAYHQWAGGDGSNPAQLRQHNYIMQHQVAVVCDYVMRLPYVPAQEANETVEQAVSGGNLVFGTRDTHTRAQAQGNTTGRYNAGTGSNPVLNTYPVVALALDEQDLAKQTSRTVYNMNSTNAADDLSGILVSEVNALSAVTSPGDYYVDYPVGVVFLYSADGVTVPAAISGAAGTVRITYYRNSAVAGTLGKFTQVLGASVKPGDFLKCGTGSNFVALTGGEDPREYVGQVLGFEMHPRDSLDRVRTAYNPPLSTDSSGSMANGTLGSASNNLGQLDQMPGSATGGYPDALSYSGGANLMLVVNLVNR